jgi:hypothetical protein
MKKSFVLSAIAILAAVVLVFTGCEGPAGPQGAKGDDGGTVINLGPFTGSASAGDISAAIAAALAGKTGSGPYTVTVTGVDLTNDADLKNLYYGIADGIASGDINLDLSACTGWGISYSAVPAVAKARYVSLILPATVKDIGSGSTGTGAFAGFTGLASVTASGVTTVGNFAFQSCTSLMTVTLPVATSFGNSTFNGCTSLATVSLPAATSFGGSTFSGCTSLATVTLGAATPTIGGSTFYSTGTTQAVTIQVPSTSVTIYNTWLTTEATNLNIPAGKSVTIAALP